MIRCNTFKEQMKFDTFKEQMTLIEKEKAQLETSYWGLGKGNNFVFDVRIQGDAAGADKEYLETARMVFDNWDKYHCIAIRELKRWLKQDYEYYCTSVWFHEYWYGMGNSSTEKGGFEMMFYQEKPNDDRYVIYVIQFAKSGCDVGLRIFSW